MENTTEIMEIEKEEIMEPEEIETEGSGGSLTAFGLGVGAALLGGIVYKYVAKPAIAKWKSRKESKAEIIDVDDDFDEDVVEVNIEDEK